MSQTTFKHVSEISESLMSDQLETNLLNWCQWSMLGIGGFFNVSLSQSGAYGEDKSRLGPVRDDNYVNGQVWQGFRKDWVWESGVQYHTQPVNISGVYVDGTFRPASGVGTYAHHVDYPNGRVVFDTAIPTTSVVKCEYAHRLFHFSTADTPWWRQFQANSFRVDDPHFLQAGSGAWSVLAQNRIQLPAVIIEAIPRTDRKPKQLGGGHIVRQDVLFHIVSDTRWEMKTMHDILTYQQEKRLDGFDKNRMWASGVFPLDHNGSRVEEALMYPDLIKPNSEGGYKWEQIRLEDVRSFDHHYYAPLYYTTVRVACEVDLP